MARTTAAILAQAERHIPEVYRVKLRPLLAAWSAALRQAELVADSASLATTVGGADGIWLDLLARGYGILRAPDETDTTLQARIRNVANRLTVTAIVDQTDALLPSGTSSLIEHWRSGIFVTDDDDLVVDPGDGFSAYCDCAEMVPGAVGFASFIYDAHNAFTLVLPLFGTVDDLDAVYSAIVSQTERLRAAGVRWWILIDV